MLKGFGFEMCFEGQGDLVNRLITGIIGVSIWLIGG